LFSDIDCKMLRKNFVVIPPFICRKRDMLLDARQLLASVFIALQSPLFGSLSIVDMLSRHKSAYTQALSCWSRAFSCIASLHVNYMQQLQSFWSDLNFYDVSV